MAGARNPAAAASQGPPAALCRRIGRRGAAALSGRYACSARASAAVPACKLKYGNQLPKLSSTKAPKPFLNRPVCTWTS